MGSDSSDNNTEFENIEELCNMQVGNWDLVESINMLETTKKDSCWVDAVYAAVEYIKRECV